MNIKSLLLGSAAALAAVSGAQAADAIVAAEPEPMEYVRVCDAFGTGFFYIPGTETCLKIGGYVRFQVDIGEDRSGSSEWDAFTRGQLDIDARSDTEFGALRGFIGLRGNADNTTNRSTFIDQAFIELGGLKVGYFYNWWDDGLSGETDVLATNSLFNSVRYTYTAGAFYAGLSADELESLNTTISNNNVGISGIIGGAFGPAKVALLGGYDTDREEGAVRLIATADLGPGSLGLAGVWASDVNAYYAESEWAVAVEYAVKVTDKFKITPGFQYFDNVDFNDAGRDAWKAGLTLDYQLATNFSAKASVQYYDEDGSDESWGGYLRLQRSF
jgi:opacity protein-like surface antigen